MGILVVRVLTEALLVLALSGTQRTAHAVDEAVVELRRLLGQQVVTVQPVQLQTGMAAVAVAVVHLVLEEQPVQAALGSRASS